jgi:hypothetical protein
MEGLICWLNPSKSQNSFGQTLPCGPGTALSPFQNQSFVKTMHAPGPVMDLSIIISLTALVPAGRGDVLSPLLECILLSSKVACSQFMEVAFKTSFQKTAHREVDLDCMPSFRCQSRRAFPGQSALTAFTPLPRSGVEEHSPTPVTFFGG